MKELYPNIIVNFVPGGCTGLAQPLDIGIQRVMKLSMKRAAHRDLVEEASCQIAKKTPPERIKLDTTLGAIRDINNVELIKKAWEMCRTGTGDFNLSQESLTSPEALALLRTLHVDYPALYQEFTQGSTKSQAVDTNSVEEASFSQALDDHCDVPVEVLAAHIASGNAVIAGNFAVGEDGGLARADNAKTSDAEEEEEVPEPILGRGHRQKRPNRLYGAAWEQH
ncbi:hypothetical protein C8F04DRAFT_1283555 [Mycena alexandri]|uniref:Uncharacterized protein n=1 Tax=Mycena alexandri TaxID=1745969 RepID=A0AAD6WJZ5_9AGAR|nr:hypothetical protein C8F04DRAFT_1283555 [Mycena alexandri]